MQRFGAPDLSSNRYKPQRNCRSMPEYQSPACINGNARSRSRCPNRPASGTAPAISVASKNGTGTVHARAGGEPAILLSTQHWVRMCRASGWRVCPIPRHGQPYQGLGPAWREAAVGVAPVRGRPRHRRTGRKRGQGEVRPPTHAKRRKGQSRWVGLQGRRITPANSQRRCASFWLRRVGHFPPLSPIATGRLPGRSPVGLEVGPWLRWLRPGTPTPW